MMHHRYSQSGNVFVALFAGIALVGILGVAVMSFMRGPLTGMSSLTKINTAQTQMQMGAQLSIMSAASAGSGGDCDSDSFVEPFGFKSTVGAKPTGGGLIPDEIAASKQDPWGSTYGYCAWNHGSDISNTCGTNGANRLAGANTQAWTSLAIISAGPDKTFQTTCSAFADTAPADGNPDTALVAKTAGSDDVIFDYTYANAVGASGGLWRLKSGNPNVTELTSSTRTADLRMADQTALGAGSCTGANDLGRVRYDSVSAGVQVCNFVSSTYDWRSMSGGGSGTIDGLSDAIAEYVSLFNVFLGDQSGVSATGGYNTAVGSNVLRANTTGARNVAIGSGDNTSGFAAFRANTSGLRNVAIGVGALRSATTATGNVGVGDDVMRALTTSSNNTAVGATAQRSITSGNTNTSVGTSAGRATTTASSNTALGTEALMTNTTGNNIAAAGWGALRANTTAASNVGIGYGALLVNTTGNNSVAVGHQALTANTTGYINTAVGAGAMITNTTSYANTAIGYEALNKTTNSLGYGNTAIGRSSLYANTTGAQNTAIGDVALTANTTGGSNVAVGYGALLANTTGLSNTAFGYQSLISNTTGNDNTAVGRQTLSSNTTGCCNVAVGTKLLGGMTSGGYNIGFGGSTNNLMPGNLNGTNGSGNIAFGIEANISNDGSDVISIGYGTGPGGFFEYTIDSNSIQIGTGATTDTGGYYDMFGDPIYGIGDNSIRLGDASITAIEGQVAFTATSDRRLKKDIEPIDLGLDFVMGLKPVSYRMKNGNGKLDYGFIAQDIAALVGEDKTNLLTHKRDKTGTYMLRHTDLIAPVVKAVQTQHLQTDSLENVIDRQANTLKELTSAIPSVLQIITLFIGMLFGFVAMIFGRRLIVRYGGVA